ncbi:Uma2 family endonuclease [Zavarzinella formosa]|uniref:Uma2 family endonuclease n=1 Tax=Zavarzinella formosa TaxID=360055 RepID=UPI0002EC4C99
MAAAALATGVPDPVEYPDSDGEPIAENTQQFDWIMMLKGELDDLFRQDPNVFVAGDLLWYPEFGNPANRIAPDTMVIFGRPKGHRGSYKQWLEGGICPQVVFEVLSPGNRPGAMTEKFRRYESLGVEEYYIYDPEDFSLQGFIREANVFRGINPMDGWISPRLGITFVHDGASKLRIRKPDGTFFRDYLEVTAEAVAAKERVLEVEDELEEERQASERKLRAERRKTEKERQAADIAKEQADKAKEQADKAKKQADIERQRADLLAAKLRELGINPDDVK